MKSSINLLTRFSTTKLRQHFLHPRFNFGVNANGSLEMCELWLLMKNPHFICVCQTAVVGVVAFFECFSVGRKICIYYVHPRRQNECDMIYTGEEGNLEKNALIIIIIIIILVRHTLDKLLQYYFRGVYVLLSKTTEKEGEEGYIAIQY